jgi:hypothetical protein
MRLRDGEYIVRKIKRHYTPYIFKILKIAVVIIPVYVVFFMIGDQIGVEWLLVILAIVSFFTGIILAIVSIDYLMDKLMVTNKRVVWINWKSIFKKLEHEAELIDIQDIDTQEKGLLANLKFFDYGVIEVETAGSKTCIIFPDCPDPAGIKTFILNQMEKSRGGIHEKHEKPGQNEDWSVN